ncbi:MAG: hypothetical protein HY805_02970 [Nitrospirae bacterium]|nr:hypothetical protein [Nitrospirota bacterium]
MALTMVYGVGFFVMFFSLWKALKVSSSVFEDAFYMLSTFALCKGTAVLLGLRLEGFYMASSSWLEVASVSFSGMFSVIANVFLFQSALDFLLYKLPTKVRFRIVPLFMFSGYLFLYISNIIEANEIEKIGRLSFGFHSSILISIAMFNLYYINTKKSIGLVILGIGFILYAIGDGLIIDGALFGIGINIIRLICILLFVLGCFFVKPVIALEKKPASKIAYI